MFFFTLRVHLQNLGGRPLIWTTGQHSAGRDRAAPAAAAAAAAGSVGAAPAGAAGGAGPAAAGSAPAAASAAVAAAAAASGTPRSGAWPGPLRAQSKAYAEQRPQRRSTNRALRCVNLFSSPA
eukprot:8820356-Pyramimonas_sp.AAC.2